MSRNHTDNSTHSHQLDQQIMLTVPQVAAVCGVSARTVKRWIHNDNLPSHRLPGAGARPIIAVSRPDLDEWLGRHRHDPNRQSDTDRTFKIDGQRFLKDKSSAKKKRA